MSDEAAAESDEGTPVAEDSDTADDKPSPDAEAPLPTSPDAGLSDAGVAGGDLQTARDEDDLVDASQPPDEPDESLTAIDASTGRVDANTSTSDGPAILPDLWLAQWGGANEDSYGSFAVSPNRTLIHTGSFASESIDLDPTAGEDVRRHLVEGNDIDYAYDGYVSWINSDGSYAGGCTFPGNPGSVLPRSVATGPDDRAVIAGTFTGTVDFDPGPGEELRTETVPGGNFLLALTASCEVSWVHTWRYSSLGEIDFADRRPLSSDSEGNLYLAGTFMDTFDFDLGPGQEERGPDGGSYILKLDPDGEFEWVQTFSFTKPSVIQVNRGGDTIVVGGAFGGTANLDFEPGEELHTGEGETDGYAIALNAEGERQWGWTWPGDGFDRHDVDVAGSGLSGTVVLGGSSNGFFTHRDAAGQELWLWDRSYKVLGAAVLGDGDLALLGSLASSQPLNPTDPPNPTPPFYGSQFLSVFSNDGTYRASHSFGGDPSTVGHDVIVVDDYVYVGGALVGTSWLLENGENVRATSRGARDSFIFRTRRPSE